MAVGADEPVLDLAHLAFTHDRLKRFQKALLIAHRDVIEQEPRFGEPAFGGDSADSLRAPADESDRERFGIRAPHDADVDAFDEIPVLPLLGLLAPQALDLELRDPSLASALLLLAESLLGAEQLPAPARQLGEDRDLGAQDMRVERLLDVVDGSVVVAFVNEGLVVVHRRDEDDRDIAHARASLDDREAVSKPSMPGICTSMRMSAGSCSRGTVASPRRIRPW